MSGNLRPFPTLLACLVLALCPTVGTATAAEEPAATDPILQTALHAAQTLSDP